MPKLMWGMVISMLGAIAVVALFRLRYPLRMLPPLLFEMTWKLIWLVRIGLPLWYWHRFDAASASMASAVLMVVTFPFVVPWRYVIQHYVTDPGDLWRSTTAFSSPIASNPPISRYLP